MAMYQAFFAGKGLVALPIVTMLLFVAVFCAVTVRARRRAPTQHVSRLPLVEDDEDNGVDHG